MPNHLGKVIQVLPVPELDEWVNEPKRKALAGRILEEQAQEWATQANDKFGYEMDLSTIEMYRTKRVLDGLNRPWIHFYYQWRSFKPMHELKILHKFAEMPNAIAN